MKKDTESNNRYHQSQLLFARRIEDFKKYIIPLLLECGKLTTKSNSELNIKNKGSKKGFVTNIDLAIGKTLCHEISKMYNNDSILCEDSAKSKIGTSNIVWYIDPLDGTTNYIHSFPFFAISISCYDEKKLDFIASAVYIPYFKQLFEAYGRKYVSLNKKQIRVSNCKDIRQSLVLTGMSFGVNRNSNEINKFIKISSSTSGTRRTGSAVFDMSYVAAGFADAYYHFNLKPWDIAAGCHLIKNAGGKVSNIRKDNKLDLADKTILGSNGFIHESLKQELNS